MNIQTPHSRNTDPETSHLAGEKITKSGVRRSQQKEVEGYVRQAQGLTSRELSEKFNADYHMIARRLPELVTVEKGAARTCLVGGHSAVTWWLVL